MRYLRFCLVTLALSAFCVSSSFAEKNLNFSSTTPQWYEFTLSGGWGLYQSAANYENLNGGTDYLFDDGSKSSGTIRAEVGWGASESSVLSLGIWYSRSAGAKASSDETTPADYTPDPNDDYVFNRSVVHHLTAPYMRVRHFFHDTRHGRYFFSGGMVLGIARATLKYSTSGIDEGDRAGSVSLGDTRIGIFGSVGFKHSMSPILSLEGELGYRYFDHMALARGEHAITTPPYPFGPSAFRLPSALKVDYAGPFALLGITLRP
jgi:hypothetical protein